MCIHPRTHPPTHPSTHPPTQHIYAPTHTSHSLTQTNRAPDLPIVVYDMGLTRAQRKTILTWDGVELKRCVCVCVCVCVCLCVYVMRPFFKASLSLPPPISLSFPLTFLPFSSSPAPPHSPRYPFERYPAHVRTLANYAWKLPLVMEAVQELKNILYLDSSIELRGPIDEIREMLAGEGYFFTTQVRCIHWLEVHFAIPVLSTPVLSTP